jgi:peptidoglycan/LPS O-acetylase OafA/YrhL
MDKKKTNVYFENLDCLRAFAALMVICIHISSWLKFPDTPFYSKLELCLSLNDYGGRCGVYFFFVISGFLITYLMFTEQASVGSLSVKNFYIRRVLRIWPLYFLVLLIGFFVYPVIINVFAHGHYTERANLIMYSCFLANYENIHHYSPNGILGVQWSVAIEEQFYLIWPLLFILFDKNKFPVVLLLVTISSELFYMSHLNQFKEQYFNTIGVMRYLSFGALLAWLCYNKPDDVKLFLSKIPSGVMVLIYITALSSPFLINMLFGANGANNFLNSIIPMFFFGFVIIEQNYSNRSFFKFGRIKFLNWLGKISYGLYLIHMIAIYMVNFLFSKLLPERFIGLQIVMVFAFTITMSAVSYNYFEKYFLKLKDKFR